MLSWTSSLIQFTTQLHNHLCQHNERGKTEAGQVSRRSGRRSSLHQHCRGVSLAWDVQAFHLLCSVPWSFKKLPVQDCIIPGFVCLSFPFQVLYILEVRLAIKIPGSRCRIACLTPEMAHGSPVASSSC